MTALLDFARSEPLAALAVAGALLALLAWLGWRRPTWLFLLALASLAIRPQLLWGGPEVSGGAPCGSKPNGYRRRRAVVVNAARIFLRSA